MRNPRNSRRVYYLRIKLSSNFLAKLQKCPRVVRCIKQTFLLTSHSNLRTLESSDWPGFIDSESR